MKARDASRGPGGAWLPILGSLLGGCALLCGSAAVVFEPPIVASLRNDVFDAFQRARPRPYVDAPVRIVDVDEESLARLGQWPWPRSRVADLVDALRAEGAASIAFDVLFAEPDRTSPAEWARAEGGDPRLAALLAGLPDPDQRLAEAMRAAGNVVLGFALAEDLASRGRHPAAPGRFVAVGGDPARVLDLHMGAAINLPMLESAAAGVGSISFSAATDGVVRSVPLLYRLGEALQPSLVAEALRVARGAKSIGVRCEASSGAVDISGLKIGSLTVPTDRRGEVWLYVTPSVPERYVPAWKVLAHEVPPQAIAGRVVFVGTSAKGLLDLRVSPLGAIVPGVELHAQLAEQIASGSMLLRPSWARALEVVTLLGIGLVLVVAGSRVGAGASAAIGLALIVGLVGASWFAFTQARTLLDPITPSLAAIGAWLAVSVPRQLQLERAQRWVQAAFSRYVSPNLVSHLLENPGTLGLGGEWRECSFVMTDLAGFTGLLEKQDPADVVALLNEYIDHMVAIAFRHEGTLDRIVGDAVAVIFSAPVAQANHAERALRCALEMDAFASEFSRKKRGEGFALGGTRIGVHGGKVLVGNFGGSTMLDYRALGDPINTAARLESVNKQLGTRVCVSAQVVSQVAEFQGRPVGTLVLKGKSEGVEAFEPLAARAEDGSDPAAYLVAFDRLASRDPSALEAFRALQERFPNDGLVGFHLARLERGDRGATVVLTEK